MSQKQNSNIAQKLLAGIGKGADANTIAALFSDDVEFEIPGDDGVLPWIGRRRDTARLPTSFVARAV